MPTLMGKIVIMVIIMAIKWIIIEKEKWIG